MTSLRTLLQRTLLVLTSNPSLCITQLDAQKWPLSIDRTQASLDVMINLERTVSSRSNELEATMSPRDLFHFDHFKTLLALQNREAPGQDGRYHPDSQQPLSFKSAPSLEEERLPVQLLLVCLEPS